MFTIVIAVLAACGNSSDETTTPANSQSLNNNSTNTTDNDSSIEESDNGDTAETSTSTDTNESNNEADSSDNASVSLKDKYLQKLNELEAEIQDKLNNSKATTTVEMEEEEADRYKRWDEALNEVYGILEEQLPKEKMDQLRVEQRNWIKERDKLAKEASLKYEGGTMESLEYVATQASLTQERAYELVARYMQ